MAWTTPTTRATGDLITSSIWNTDLVNNLLYLSTMPASTSFNQPTRSIGVSYQPNTTHATLVVLSMQMAAGDTAGVHVSASSPASAGVLVAYLQSPTSSIYMPCTFIVPAAWYYAVVVGAGSPSISVTNELPLM
jgi:hypothetical protein